VVEHNIEQGRRNSSIVTPADIGHVRQAPKDPNLWFFVQSQRVAMNTAEHSRYP
jgi:hypothetical protein